MLDLVKCLSRFQGDQDIETSNALFMLNLSWISSRAYLNVIYKPALPPIRSSIGEILNFPETLYEFYKHYNGARLFFDTLRIYGCVPEDTPLNRADPLTLPPFDILSPNEEFEAYIKKDELICIGSYGYDRSMVCMDRSDQQIICFKGTEFVDKRKTWVSLESWITEELDRLGGMFSSEGKRLGEEHQMLPGFEN